MDDQYYRKAQPRHGIVSWLKKISRNRRILRTLLVVIPVISFMLFSNKGVLKRLSLESEKRAMEGKIHQAQLDQNRLQQQSKALDKDEKAIEKVAREKYGMIREGETVYKVKKER